MAKTSREWKVPCPVQLVWDVATDLEHTAWRSDLKSLEIREQIGRASCRERV